MDERNIRNIGKVTEHLINLIARQVEDNGIVVWYDPVGYYAAVAKALELPNTTVLCYEGSFMGLRYEIDQRNLMDGDDPPRLVVYVPLSQDKTHHALIELEAGGVVMQPGQQPPARNTRLAILARNALKDIVGEENASDIERQTEAGRLTLSDLDALAEKGDAISSVLPLIFGTRNPQEVALSFLTSDSHDAEITRKGAAKELTELLKREFDLVAVSEAPVLVELRQQMARYVLMTDMIAGLGNAAPPQLGSCEIASAKGTKEACVALAETWRLRRDKRECYVTVAKQVELDFGLRKLSFNPKKIAEVDTFPVIELELLDYAEKRLLEEADGEILNLAELRLSRFWCDADPMLQAQWALVASAAEVLLETDHVANALKNAPTSLAALIQEYADTPTPWCKLDTAHRNMESKWHNFEPGLGENNDSLEKLIVKARQRYEQVGSDLAQHFVMQFQKSRQPAKGILRQQEVFEKYVKPALGKEKVAYIWVDALRFEMGRELVRLLQEDFTIEITPALAAVPTITEIGMAALLPGAQDNAKVVEGDTGKLALEIDGTRIKNRKDRVSFLKDHAGASVFDTKLDDLLRKPLAKRLGEGIAEADLILVTVQEIDELCEQDNMTQARRQMDGVLNDLRRGVRVLANNGIQRIVLTSDHGHIFSDELGEAMKINPPGGKTVDLHRRVWVGQGGETDNACARIPLAALGMGSEYDLVTPLTLACFKSPGGARAYFHGGLSPQEVIIPVMVLVPRSRVDTGGATGIKWEIVPGSQKLTTRFFSVQIRGANAGLFEAKLPRVRVELRAKGKPISRPVSASYGFDEAAKDVELKWDADEAKSILPNTVALMVDEDIDQKTVSLCLLNADSGVELARLEGIEVAITKM